MMKTKEGKLLNLIQLLPERVYPPIFRGRLSYFANSPLNIYGKKMKNNFILPRVLFLAAIDIVR